MGREDESQEEEDFHPMKRPDVSRGFLGYESEDLIILVRIYRDYIPFMVVEYVLDDTPYRERIEFELFWDDVPRTSLNFAMLLAGFEVAGEIMQYEGSFMHRVVAGFVTQGGDFTKFDGSGGVSIYGKYFDDENFVHRHLAGSLSMANAGPNTNSSQFFISFNDLPCLDGVHVVFGRVRSRADMRVIRKMERVRVDLRYRPVNPIRIVLGDIFLPVAGAKIP